jgi:hypothetical protein
MVSNCGIGIGGFGEVNLEMVDKRLHGSQWGSAAAGAEVGPQQFLHGGWLRSRVFELDRLNKIPLDSLDPDPFGVRLKTL